MKYNLKFNISYIGNLLKFYNKAQGNGNYILHEGEE